MICHVLTLQRNTSRQQSESASISNDKAFLIKIKKRCPIIHRTFYQYSTNYELLKDKLPTTTTTVLSCPSKTMVPQT